jgi:WhiB family redox-sensing transcriptional regulator
MARAACVGCPTSLFVPDEDHIGRGNRGQVHYTEAKAVCARCPVTQECLEYGLSHEGGGLRFGMYGGLSPEERRKLNIRRHRRTA